MREQFKLEGITYEVTIDHFGGIAFAALYGANRRGFVDTSGGSPFDDDHAPVMGDMNITQNPLAILNKVGKIVVEWVNANRPYKFGFSAITKRKVKVYRYLVNRLMRKLKSEYTFVEYPEGCFRFYKRVEST